MDLDIFYRHNPSVEEEVQAALDETLSPRGPDLLYDLVATLGLPTGSRVLDVGCGDGRHSARLADRFGFTVIGIDPVDAPGVSAAGRATKEAIAAADLRIDLRIDLASEWGEHTEERGPTRKLLHAARLLRDPGRYIERFGRPTYDIALGDCLWHIYRMLGHLRPRIYVLSAA